MSAASIRPNPLIFIAYDVADAELVRRVCDTLRTKGHRISLPQGDEKRARTGYQEKAMQDCEVLLVFGSPSSIKSNTVKQQVMHFYKWLERRMIITLKIGMAEKEKWYIPISTEKQVDLIHPADDDGYASALDELDGALNHLYRSPLRLTGSYLFHPVEPGSALPNPQPAEIVKVYPQFPLDDFGNMVTESKELIRIADIWTPIVGSDGESLGTHGEAFAQAAKRKVQIEILLLNPISPLARRRSLDLRLPENEVFKNVRESIDQISGLHEHINRALNSREAASLGFRLYNSLPSFPIYVVDGIMLFGQYPYGRRAFAAPWFQVQHGSVLFKTIMDEFESRWRGGTDYPDMQWQVNLLNANQITVLRYVAAGYQAPFIAKATNYTTHTIRGMIQEIYAKLDVLNMPQKNRRVAAVNKARDLGIID